MTLVCHCQPAPGFGPCTCPVNCRTCHGSLEPTDSPGLHTQKYGRVRIGPATAKVRLARILDDLEGLAMPPVDVARQARRIRNLLAVLGVELSQ